MTDPFIIIIGLLIVILLIREIVWRVRLRRAMRAQRDAVLSRSRSVLKGLIGEQLAPLLPDFPFHPGDVRFVGGVVDFIVFAGQHENRIDEVVLVDVKSGEARLSPLQREVARAVEEGRVRFETVRIK